MNDDFLYKRQESPAPEFVAELRESLHQVEEPQKAKRKNGQRRFNWKWKAVAAVMVMMLLGTFIWNQPEVRIPVTNFILGNPAEDALQEIDEALGFEIPKIPSGFYVSTIQFTDGFTTDDVLEWLDYYELRGVDDYIPVDNFTAYWVTYREDCAIKLSVSTIAEADEEWYVEYYQYLDERSEKVELVELDSDTIALWRWLTLDNVEYGMDLEWHYQNIDYKLESTMDCVSREDFISIAQSTLDDRP
jgi:hypothetical protein